MPTAGPPTFNAAWLAMGPNPIVQNTVYSGTGSFAAQAGRIGAAAIRPSTGTFIVGGAQGGVWTYDPAAQKWSTTTDDMDSLAIGALAVAPSNDAIVYAGTGEGHLPATATSATACSSRRTAV